MPYSNLRDIAGFCLKHSFFLNFSLKSDNMPNEAVKQPQFFWEQNLENTHNKDPKEAKFCKCPAVMRDEILKPRVFSRKWVEKSFLPRIQMTRMETTDCLIVLRIGFFLTMVLQAKEGVNCSLNSNGGHQCQNNTNIKKFRTRLSSISPADLSFFRHKTLDFGQRTEWQVHPTRVAIFNKDYNWSSFFSVVVVIHPSVFLWRWSLHMEHWCCWIFCLKGWWLFCCC